MERITRVDKKFYLVTFSLVLYFLLRFTHPQTIEFGHDQPKLAFAVLDFIKNPTFSSSYEFVSKNAWGLASWGPAQIFFYVPFFIISRNPFWISIMIAVFNSLSVVFVFLIGTRFFSTKVAFVSSLVLATHPWWVIFSKMIYQPTPIPTFIAFTMLISFLVFENKKTKLISLVVVMWAILIQIYYHSVSFVLASSLIFTTFIKQISKKYLLLGIIISIFLFTPYFPGIFHPSNSDSNVQLDFVEERDNFVSRIKLITPHFISILSGSDLKWQLGYGYEDFISNFKGYKYLEIFLFYVTLLIIVYHFIAAISVKRIRHLRLIILFWTIAPIIFLSLINLPNVLPIPRYFLVSLPALAILFGIFFEETSNNKRIIKPIYLMIIILLLGWIHTSFKYSSFVINYNYPNGYLSTFSDVPYHFINASIKLVLKDAQMKDVSKIVLSTDTDKPKEYALDWASWYIWSEVYNQNTEVPKDGEVVYYYVIDYKPEVFRSNLKNIGSFGPYVVYRVEE